VLRPFDRRVALGVVAGATVAVVISVALADAGVPAGEPVPARNDARAYAQLVDLLEARDAGDWRVDFRTERLTPARTSASDITEARAVELRAVASGTTLTVERSGTRVECTRVGGTPECLRAASGSELPAAAVLRTAVEAGGYAVQRAPGRRVAFEDAACFRIVRLRGPLPGYGDRSEHCFAADGVPLWARVEQVGAMDTRTAVAVQRGGGRAAIEALARSYGLPLDRITTLAP
jgi:hypothetical protein